MSEPPMVKSFDEALSRAHSLVEPGKRRMLGIAGSPGAGKTTLANAVVEALNDASPEGLDVAVALPMDGFHLANATLRSLGRHDRKGAIDTFDAWGFLALVRRLRLEADHDVYAPSFRRDVDEPIAGEIVIATGIALVVVEGNYLLADQPPWNSVRDVLDEIWFCATPDVGRVDRLVRRHVQHGRTPDAAAAWARDVDGRNADLIEGTRARSDVIISGEIPLVPTGSP